MTHSCAMRGGLAAVAVLALAATMAAQPPQEQGRRPQMPDTGGRSATYDPLKTFAPYTMPLPPSGFRGADGAPTPTYWQNSADYEMHASIDTASKVLTNVETITYTNNSAGSLNSLWLQVEQNTYRADARSRPFSGGSRQRPENINTEGTVFESMELLSTAKGAKPVKAEYVISDTRARINLPAPLAHGATIKILIKYHYTMPGQWGGRTSVESVKDGPIYDVAQWYPRMCVYDDLHGWDTQPFLGNEFYTEFGNYDMYITVPANYLVAGSGLLVNEADVLTKTQQDRLKQARASDKTVFIRTLDEVHDPASRPKQDGTLTWHYHMDRTRDAVFSASPSFLWDAAKMNLPGGKNALSMSFYPAEAVGDEGWGRTTEYTKDTVENFSRDWYPYPWPVMTNVAGFSSGMEYPAMVFDGIRSKGKGLFVVTAHEVGHTWFPMIVQSNERRDAWMDEGFNTFIDIYESEQFNKGIWGPKRDGEYAPGGGYPADEIAKVIADPEAPPMLSRADAIREKYRHPITYFKSAEGLYLLREEILGHEIFDRAFRKYIADWAFKHPTPSDFFRAMESEGGEDLSYFWRGWYENNWTMDMAAKDVKYNDPSDPSKGAKVTIEQNGQLVLPAWVQVKYEDGTDLKIKLPAETWMQKATYAMPLPTTKKIAEVTIDPEHRIPDGNRANNTAKP
ncbi:M1 family metallopeptidase [Terriglobus tenax]|uniref:M1 family metallopeptidase n=1 Tax=Terriglobus tenax TaxID=1111115 RepID=UPI0021E0E491|nr:M1 family metallopeptidase [Terriglobus tenax]